ncbi:MAG: cryptochrome/photolyase family protein [Planctomycetota bacterium]
MAPSFNLRSLRSTADTLFVVLGDQLDRESPILEQIDAKQDAVLMMEVEHESRNPASHKQRTAMFLAAMRHHALWLRDEQGLRVEYVRLDDEENTQSFAGEIERAVERFDAKQVVVVEPGDHRVRADIERACGNANVDLKVLDDSHFLTTPADFGEWASGRKQLTMEYFYREQRRKLDMLMDGKDPVGGEWNYDKENRETFKGPPRPTPPPSFEPDDITREVMDLIEDRMPDLPGSMDGFGWPVTREQALEALDDFIENRLARFGKYEDAMWTEQRTLYHARLSPAVNLHLISPIECAERAVEAYEAGDAPLNSVEGFVRQHIGWREFIRGVYFFEGDGYSDRNELGDEGNLPEFYWTGETDMACMADCVGSVVEEAYAHHIPRLMVMGNFAMLAGVEPKQVADWYLGMFADGVDWVTAPNVVGMALHADGGVVGTKPYAASGKYIKRMSNYCDNCAYKVSKRTGEDACPFNTLYWDFLIRHRETFRKNNRMAMILKNVDRLKDDERVEITVSARKLRRKLGVSEAGSGLVPSPVKDRSRVPAG